VRFVDVTAAAGISFRHFNGAAGRKLLPETMGGGVAVLDYDRDGRPDLFHCNGHLEPDIAASNPGQTYAQAAQLFWNTGDPADLFRPADPAACGADLFRPLVGRGCAFVDYDGDGDLDIVLAANGGPARLVRTDDATGHHALRLTLEGDGRTVNRDAIGAEVTVEVGGVVRHYSVSAARGYLSQSELTVTAGLGREPKADRVTVRWPTAAGHRDEWRDLPAGAHRLTFGRP